MSRAVATVGSGEAVTDRLTGRLEVLGHGLRPGEQTPSLVRGDVSGGPIRQPAELGRVPAQALNEVEHGKTRWQSEKLPGAHRDPVGRPRGRHVALHEAVMVSVGGEPGEADAGR